jgi:two-component system OmpR family response regulator/two-component system response regulator QseB
MRILLAEDDLLLGDGLRAGLQQLGFQVDWVRDGQAAERELRAEPYAAAVLDLGLPLLDGMDVLASVRRSGVTLPVLVLTARDAVAERIRGLDLGADDYVLKPVDLHELAARLRALVRRAHGQPQEDLRVRDLVLDPAAHAVSRAGELVTLSTREFDLLHVLMLNAGRVLSREQLEQHLYSWGREVDSNAIACTSTICAASSASQRSRPCAAWATCCHAKARCRQRQAALAAGPAAGAGARPGGPGLAGHCAADLVRRAPRARRAAGQPSGAGGGAAGGAAGGRRGR